MFNSERAEQLLREADEVSHEAAPALLALIVAAIIAVFVVASTPASGAPRGLITVDTDAGPITVAPEFAPKIVPFVNAVVALTGQKPARLKCYSRAPSHVPGSLHFVGRACDFAQRGWGRTSYKIMYRIEALARQYGLRDGCEFRDWGHIDDGTHLPPSRTHGCKSGPFVTALQMQAMGAAP